MDNSTFSFLKKLKPRNSKIYKISEVEESINGLKGAKKNRNRIEYFFTCSSAICKFILIKNPNIPSITYLDSDLYFFSSPKVIFDEIGNHSIAIIEHRFHWFTKRQAKFGIYNVGWITFKNDQEGNICLENWLEQCIDWCYQKVEKNRYGDQKYLDSWPSKYKNLLIIKNIGANAAIWNAKNYKWQIKENKVFLNETPLVFYHFANVFQIDRYLFNTNLSRVLVSLNGVLKNNVYKVFLKNLSKNLNHLPIQHKKDTHNNSFKKRLITSTRVLRAFLFNDILDIRK